MIDVPELFKVGVIEGSTTAQLRIVVFNWVKNDDGTTSNLNIYNDNIVSESMVVEQSISDSAELKFGGCIASRFEIELANIPDLTGGYITVFFTQGYTALTYPGQQTFPGAVYPGGNAGRQEFKIFSGDIISCKLSKNRIIRKLVAYDRFYSKGQIDCTNWYLNWFGNRTRVTVRELRKALLSRFAIIENNPDEKLPADDLLIYKLSGKITVSDLLQQICEVSGCFMFFNGDGNIDYIYINQEKYANGENTETYAFYKDLEVEEYTKQGYSHLLIQNLEDGTVTVKAQDNDIEKNVYAIDCELVSNGWNRNTWINSAWTDIAIDIYEKNPFNIKYTPLRMDSESRLWVEVGDKIIVKQRWYDEQGNSYVKNIESIVLSRTIKGISALKDEIISEGENKLYTEEDYVG